MKGQKKAAYVSIALDIANKILNGEFREKQKISGRSTLASMYNVSPEVTVVPVKSILLKV